MQPDLSQNYIRTVLLCSTEENNPTPTLKYPQETNQDESLV